MNPNDYLVLSAILFAIGIVGFLTRRNALVAFMSVELMLNAANLALVGDELIQFARAAPLGGGRWALSELWRGHRGTRAAAGTVGDRFALLTADSVRTIDLPLASLGGTARLMAARPASASSGPE